MFNIFSSLKKWDDEHRDHRLDNLPIAASYTQILSILLAYYVFVKKIGPKLMEKRKPFDLTNVIVFYNMLQVFFNSYLVLHGCYYAYVKYSRLPVFCAAPMSDTSPPAMVEMYSFYSYFLLKIFDFFDTIFMVLRKRTRQITFLHFYHHLIMGIGVFVYLRYLPGGHNSPIGLLNAFVHAVMYSYYFITALRPELKDLIWWKKYITQFQIIQFFFTSIWFLLPVFLEKCSYPALPSAFVASQALFMLYLFSKFYFETYILKRKGDSKTLEAICHASAQNYHTD